MHSTKTPVQEPNQHPFLSASSRLLGSAACFGVWQDTIKHNFPVSPLLDVSGDQIIDLVSAIFCSPLRAPCILQVGRFLSGVRFS